MKNRLSILLVLGLIGFLFLAATPAHGASQDFPALTGRVVDNAGLFDQTQVDELTQALADFETATTNQFVVVTLDTLGENDIDQYTAELGHYWGIGQKGKDNGAVLLIALNDRKVAIKSGYGLEEKLTDGTCGDIIRQDITPFFKQGDYFNGVKAGLAAMMGRVAPDYQASFAGGLVSPPETVSTSRGSDGIGTVFMIVLFIIFSILGSIGSRSRNRRYWGRRGFSSGGGFWGGFGGGGGGGGGFGGGGGGGGGFSGGGGGFGGGGASGGW